MFRHFMEFDNHHPHHWHHRHHHHWAGPRRGHGPRGPAGADFFGDFFGPPPRADRGGVRYLVLDAISEQPRHGYEVIQAIEQRSGGTYRPSPGVVYPTLQMLEELGHARAVEADARKAYGITEEGLRDLAEHRAEVADFYERSAEHDWERQLDSFRDLKRQAAFMFRSFKRAARHGRLSPEVHARVIEVVRDALRRIEAILNESEHDERL
jgi:DNA-binding PadR family transcriptional regulator